MDEKNVLEIEKYVKDRKYFSERNMNCIKQKLDEIGYCYYENAKSEFPTIMLMFENDKSSYRVHIYTVSNQINIVLELLFKIDKEVYATLAMLVNEINVKSNFAKYYIDNEKIVGEYRYLVSEDNEFDSTFFVIYLQEVMECVDKTYGHLLHMATGKYTYEDEKYLQNMEDAIEGMTCLCYCQKDREKKICRYNEMNYEINREELITDTMREMQDDES